MSDDVLISNFATVNERYFHKWNKFFKRFSEEMETENNDRIGNLPDDKILKELDGKSALLEKMERKIKYKVRIYLLLRLESIILDTGNCDMLTEMLNDQLDQLKKIVDKKTYESFKLRCREDIKYNYKNNKVYYNQLEGSALRKLLHLKEISQSKFSSYNVYKAKLLEEWKELKKTVPLKYIISYCAKTVRHTNSIQ